MNLIRVLSRRMSEYRKITQRQHFTPTDPTYKESIYWKKYKVSTQRSVITYDGLWIFIQTDTELDISSKYSPWRC